MLDCLGSIKPIEKVRIGYYSGVRETYFEKPSSDDSFFYRYARRNLGESCKGLEALLRLKTTKEVVVRRWGTTAATKNKENPEALARFLVRWQHVETFSFNCASVLPSLAVCIEEGLCKEIKSIKINISDKLEDLKGYDGGYDARCLHRTYLFTRAIRRRDLPALEYLEASFDFTGGFQCVEMIIKALSTRICPKLTSLSLSPMPDSQAKGPAVLADCSKNVGQQAFRTFLIRSCRLIGGC